jgi:hypothetical protein
LNLALTLQGDVHKQINQWTFSASEQAHSLHQLWLVVAHVAYRRFHIMCALALAEC